MREAEHNAPFLETHQKLVSSLTLHTPYLESLNQQNASAAAIRQESSHETWISHVCRASPLFALSVNFLVGRSAGTFFQTNESRNFV